MGELINNLLMKEPDGTVEIAREFTEFHYVEHTMVCVVGVCIVYGIAFLIKALFKKRVRQ